MKIILIYLVAAHHLRNFNIIKKIYKNFKFVIIYENNIQILKKNNDFKDHYLIFNINNVELSNFLKKNRDKIFFSFLSTLQIRKSVLNLYKNLIVNNIPIFTIQETHQMYLHNENQNNYILPNDILFVCSKYEKEKFKNYYYSSKYIEISGWPYDISKSKKVINNKIQYCLLLLNASKKVNPISIETKKIQNKIIKFLSKRIPSKYMLYVKLHPSDVKENFHLTNKNIKFIDNEINTTSLIKQASIIVSSGYTQAIFESIILEKEIYIINLEAKNQIIFDLKNENILRLTEDNIIVPKKYNKKNYLKIIETNNLFITYDQICLTLKEKISNFFNSHNKDNLNYEKSLALVIWLIYLNEIKFIKSYLFEISSEPYYERVNFVYKILVDDNFKDDLLINLLSTHKNTNLFYPIKYIILKKMVKNNINFSLINNKFLDFFFVKDFKYFRSIFYNDLQFILFKISIQKNNFYFQLEKLDSINNNDLLQSKSYYFKYLILFRKKNIFFKNFLNKFLIYFLNIDKRL